MSDAEYVKKCNRCERKATSREEAEKLFSKRKAGRDGLKETCRHCIAAYMKEYNARKKTGAPKPPKKKRGAGKHPRLALKEKMPLSVKSNPGAEDIFKIVNENFRLVEEMYQTYVTILKEQRRRLIEKCDELRKVKEKLLNAEVRD